MYYSLLISLYLTAYLFLFLKQQTLGYGNDSYFVCHFIALIPSSTAYTLRVYTIYHFIKGIAYTNIF
jgi:hypothetical protein